MRSFTARGISVIGAKYEDRPQITRVICSALGGIKSKDEFAMIEFYDAPTRFTAKLDTGELESATKTRLQEIFITLPDNLEQSILLDITQEISNRLRDFEVKTFSGDESHTAVSGQIMY